MLTILDTPVSGVQLNMSTLPQHVLDELERIQKTHDGAMIEKAVKKRKKKAIKQKKKIKVKYWSEIIIHFSGRGRNPLSTYTYFEK